MARTVMITGSSSGIGKASALQFAELGDKVLLCGSSDKVIKVKEELQNQFPNASLEAFQFDLRKASEIASTFEKIKEKYQTLDILVNNAGIARGGSIETLSLEEWEELMNLNVTSFFLCCKYAIPLMKPQKHGKIINVSSIAGRSKSALAGVHYSTSKAAIIGFTRQLAQELSATGIRVNAVCPSQTRTPMLEAFLNEEVENRLKQMIPLGYVAEPSDVANVITFLASKASDYMTGSILDVNGGQL